MNKRIKSIIEQASNVTRLGVPVLENQFREGVMINYQVDTERVAELMIAECVRNLQSDGYDDAAAALAKHFGEE